mmetsp:Transcript_87778/g.200611  ORF Transcript_87778/g.200611 Transcript_87778/m.200611 type:complete len:214 (-) Transcript_87778:253-894(-)
MRDPPCPQMHKNGLFAARIPGYAPQGLGCTPSTALQTAWWILSSHPLVSGWPCPLRTTPPPLHALPQKHAATPASALPAAGPTAPGPAPDAERAGAPCSAERATHGPAQSSWTQLPSAAAPGGRPTPPPGHRAAPGPAPPQRARATTPGRRIRRSSTDPAAAGARASAEPKPTFGRPGTGKNGPPLGDTRLENAPSSVAVQLDGAAIVGQRPG